VLDRVSSITDLGVIIDEKILGFISRFSLELRDPYTLKSLYTALVRPNLKYASCEWNPFYDVRVDRVERVYR
jgi:hypothetical protein